ATETNLERLVDMLSGLETQIAALRRQARAAERYISVSDKIRLAEARLVFARWRDAAAAADAARKEARGADDRVSAAQDLAKAAQDAQHKAAAALAKARDDVFDRRQDSAAHGQRMASLSAQLEAAEQRVADIERQLARIEQDRSSADQLTADAAEAIARLEGELAAAETMLKADEARRPILMAAADDADRAARGAEVALAQRVAEQAGIDAEWRVAEAAVVAAHARLTRVEGDAARLSQQAEALAREADPSAQIAQAEFQRTGAAAALAAAEHERAELTAKREALSAQRDALSNALAQARAELSGVEREAEALARDKAAREKAATAKGRGASAIAGTRVASGYERAVAAVLGRDAAAPVGPAPGDAEGRFWTGADAPSPLADSLAHQITQCPPELTARLALVRVVDRDEGQALAPGEWLVTKAGHLRRWDGFVARGEGAAEAAALEAANRLTELEALLPARREALALAEAAFAAARDALSDVQARMGAVEKAISTASDAERAALRALDAADAARLRLEQRKAEIARVQADLAEQRRSAEAEARATQDKRASLPDPAAGRAALEAARARNDAARQGLQTTAAAMASLEQTIAVGRERLAGLKGDARAWSARAGDAAKRLAEMTGRREELEAERAILAAKPAGLIREIDEGEAIGARLTTGLAAAEVALTQCDAAAKAADVALSEANEALATAREGRAGAAARAENEDARRQEMAGISGERFQCPPPLLPQRFEFDSATVASAGDESAALDRLVAERERIGPVNLVAADELGEAEARHGTSVAEQAELTEAVHRLRGSIGNLNREGRERLRAAFEAVDGHFRRLFSRLFGGGEAHLALVDSDDPLEAGLEIFAQPPGKRLQSLTLLSGGEQALTAVALIFALFLTNPAPICVLDEVDAPLDDANIERFCDLLDAMVAETKTRYLIVTHNAVTMSRMHRLFGVTMVERGVSRLVSVDLGGAVELLEAAG
ncbi:MAG: chromosome segregation protein, partial [Novosphingobium sp.]|nr:chromosome segregation protein [Novosphingobium sp.]